MSTHHIKPYQSALLFTGGGLHCGYYLGMYQALCQQNKHPDVVIASCGGSLAASLIAMTPDDGAACELFLSRDFYHMINHITGNQPKTPLQYIIPAIGRYVRSIYFKHKKTITSQAIDALTQLALTEFDIHALASFYDKKPHHHTPIIIIGSRLIYQNNLPCRWQTVLWSSQQALTQHLLTINPQSPLHSHNPDIIDNHHYITQTLPLSVAVRASMGDMYYLPPISYQDNQESLLLMGGILNLTPIELAQALAPTIYAEHKADYDKRLAQPAIFDTFGFMANERLQQVRTIMSKNTNIHAIDTTDYRHHTKPLIGKKWHYNGSLVAQYLTFDEYKIIAKEQMAYGHRQMTRYLQEYL